YILCAVIFSLCKAKNVGDAGHRRGFLTQQKGKRTSRKCKVIIEPFLRKANKKFPTQAILDKEFLNDNGNVKMPYLLSFAAPSEEVSAHPQSPEVSGQAILNP
ncbi:MAG: hypothetical protein AAF573_03380, partial [Bacteroidota bacterium]